MPAPSGRHSKPEAPDKASPASGGHRRLDELGAEGGERAVSSSSWGVAVVGLPPSAMASLDSPTVTDLVAPAVADGPDVSVDLELGAQVASDGLGLVYDARRRSDGAPLRVRVLVARTRAGGAIVTRAAQEARRWIGLSHPALLTPLVVGSLLGRYAIVSPRPPGAPVPLPVAPPRALRLVLELARGLAWAQVHGLSNQGPILPTSVHVEGDAVLLVDCGVGRCADTADPGAGPPRPPTPGDDVRALATLLGHLVVGGRHPPPDVSKVPGVGGACRRLSTLFDIQEAVSALEAMACGDDAPAGAAPAPEPPPDAAAAPAPPEKDPLLFTVDEGTVIPLPRAAPPPPGKTADDAAVLPLPCPGSPPAKDPLLVTVDEGMVIPLPTTPAAPAAAPTLSSSRGSGRYVMPPGAAGPPPAGALPAPAPDAAPAARAADSPAAAPTAPARLAPVARDVDYRQLALAGGGLLLTLVVLVALLTRDPPPPPAAATAPTAPPPPSAARPGPAARTTPTPPPAVVADAQAEDRAVREHEARVDEALRAGRWDDALRLVTRAGDELAGASPAARARVDELELRVRGARADRVRSEALAARRRHEAQDMEAAAAALDALRAWAGADAVAAEPEAARLAREVDRWRDARAWEVARLEAPGAVHVEAVQNLLTTRLSAWARHGALYPRGGVSLRYPPGAGALLARDLVALEGRLGAVGLAPDADGEAVLLESASGAAVTLRLPLPLARPLDARVDLVLDRDPPHGAVALLVGSFERAAGVAWSVGGTTTAQARLSRGTLQLERGGGASPAPRKVTGLRLELRVEAAERDRLRVRGLLVEGGRQVAGAEQLVARDELRGELLLHVVGGVAAWITGLEVRGVVDGERLR